ncbi:Arm DNA-binding domain-containing protein [Bradyrhizobium sp. G127]|uniref:Arm DNA-binding domain-containing protein n=1 Tax=Bradyrhizobium sp. G127 TaxID=2904800 RepID=UPI001F40A5DD|nr:Arm DNA-binding domain-containing protein [Bradyrhizobium sp. G127]MCF2523897.1 Arm DNA-binding domain-containing protein [Bradyrhizobium sp. G127]
MTKGPKLTAESIRTLSAGPKGDALYSDSDSKQGVPGLYLRVRSAGSRTFVIQWSQGDFQRRSTIGKVGVLSLDEARRKARKLLVGIDEGADPIAAKARAKVSDKLRFEAVAKDYLEARESDMKASSLDQCKRHLQLYFKPFNRSTYAAEKRAALDLWGNHVALILARAEGANVVQLRA